MQMGYIQTTTLSGLVAVRQLPSEHSATQS